MFGAVATNAGVLNCQAARERFFGDGLAVGVARRVAIAASHDGVDEIAAAFERGFGDRAFGKRQQRHERDADSKHDALPLKERCMHGRSRPGNGLPKIKAAMRLT